MQFSNELLATILILISAVLHASWNAAVKKSPDKLPIMVFITAYGGFAFVPFTFLVPLPTFELWLWIIFSAFIHLSYQRSLTKMYEKNPLSYAYPIARGTGPLLVAIFSLFIFQTALEPLEIVFISSLVFGIFLTVRSAPKANIDDSSTEHNKFNVIYPLITGTLIASYTLVDAYAISLSDEILTFIIWSAVIQAPLFFTMAVKDRGIKILAQSLRTWRHGLPAALVGQIGYALALTAYSFGNVGKIAALRETSILFAGILGYFWLKENMSRQKAIALFIIMISAVALAAI